MVISSSDVRLHSVGTVCANSLNAGKPGNKTGIEQILVLYTSYTSSAPYLRTKSIILGSSHHCQETEISQIKHKERKLHAYLRHRRAFGRSSYESFRPRKRNTALLDIKSCLANLTIFKRHRKYKPWRRPFEGVLLLNYETAISTEWEAEFVQRSTLYRPMFQWAFRRTAHKIHFLLVDSAISCL